MATYGEIVYMIADELQLVSDDSFIVNEHIIFLIDKYRSLILKKNYLDPKNVSPESNYQTLCLDLETAQGIEGDDCSGTFLRSTVAIPTTMGIGSIRVSSRDFTSTGITFVSPERMKFVGHNRYLQNIIYCCIGPNSRLYLKSSNPQAYYLDKVMLSGIFEDSAKAAELSCESTEDSEAACDVLKKSFPLEEALIPILIQSVVKELSASLYRPADKENNAKDDLANTSVKANNTPRQTAQQ